MKFKKNSLKVNIWLYLAIFSIGILLFLWIFQVVFLNTYYEWYKKKEVKKTASLVETSYQTDQYDTLLDHIAHDEGVCIEIMEDGKPIYLSSGFNKGCMTPEMVNSSYHQDFIQSGLKNKTYQLVNPRYNNDSLVYALKLSNDTFAFITASLVPLDATIVILKNQFIYVTIIVLGLSFLMAYFISKKISNPIIKINETAKQMGTGNYDVSFQTDEDIDEINNLTKTLNYAKEELRKTDQLRQDLMANVSHDLKTPLTLIKAYAEMIRDLTYQDPDKRNQNLAVIIDETDRLNALVNDILDLSSVQANTDMLSMVPCDFVLLIQTVLKRYDILKEQEGYQFVYEGSKKMMVLIDQKRMEQVVYNLINNAINYTGKDKKVTINVTEDTCFHVQIIDTGKGIDDSEIDKIWDKYYHSDKKHKRNMVGTGLGLSIVKRILENHHFIYGVSSKKNKGTTFYFDIPKMVDKKSS